MYNSDMSSEFYSALLFFFAYPEGISPVEFATHTLDGLFS